MQKYRDAVMDSRGGPLSGVTVDVRLTGTATNPTIYSDNGTSSKSNPFTNDANGSFEFYAANGRYDIVLTKAGVTFDSADMTDILLHDPVVKQSLGSVGTPATTAETDLLTVTIPARTLNYVGQSIRVVVYGTTSANANTKRARLYFGGTVICDSTALAANAKDWRLEALITRTAASTQEIASKGRFNGALVQDDYQSLAITDTAAIIIKVTGTNGTAAANDLVAEGLLVMEA